ncbi:MAG TPA: S8 family serine peptidase [Pyrinomonadaceae bacterium]|jgi:subtilisin family serine protease|nr:S8 family serine peptidase [Pyrinomonadaceae bacterium]
MGLNSILRLVCGLLVATALAISAGAQKTGDYVPGEVLVKFVSGPQSKSVKASSNRAIGATIVEELGDLSWQRVRLPEAMKIDEAIAKYKDMPGVEYAQPNFYYHLLATPNDPQFSSGTMYGLFKIAAPSAWNLPGQSTGSSDVVIADIDTGMRYTHEDLAGNAWHNPGEPATPNGVDDDGNGFIDDYYGWDFRFNDADPIDLDNGVSASHGTHTAGTIGAVGNNLVGVVGVNWNVKLMTIKIFNNTVSDDTTSAMLVNAYSYIRMMKLRGINIRATNNSYGGCTEACGYDQATKDGLDALGDAGVVNVFAAGNGGTNNDTAPSYPASYTSPSVIAVAASDSNDNKASFSQYGLNSVDVAAPGVTILSTVPTGYASSGWSGTSMATPHVTGAVALLAAYMPTLSAASLKASILNNVDVLPAWNGLVKTGGRLNVFKAMQNPTVCTFMPATPSMTVPTKGGVFTVNITAGGPNCDYTAKGTGTWIKVLSTNPMSGNGIVTFRVSVNPTVTRTGTVKVGDQTITVTQWRGH